jgi:bromodomain-containing protein 7
VRLRSFCLFLILCRIGKRYRTKKERLRVEKEGPPYCTDGSLDYSASKHGTIFCLFYSPILPVEDPFSPCDPSWNLLPVPVNIPTPAYPPSPESKSNTKPTKRRHWTISRNAPTRVYKIKEKDDEDETSAWQMPREAHTVDFGAYTGLAEELVTRGLAGEEALFDAIREDVDESMDSDESSDDEYWTGKRAAEAQDYIRDVVYGGVDGLAYVRSLAEFVSPPVENVCPLQHSLWAMVNYLLF